MTAKPAPIVLVSGLSGAGKSSILHALEDLGFEAVDNPPLKLLETLLTRRRAPVALGIDIRTRGFAAERVLAELRRLRENPHLRAELIFATAEPEILLRRYTETRRRHPLAGAEGLAEAIAAEAALTAPLRTAADWVVDTSDLPLPELRRMIEQRFGRDKPSLALNLISFAFPSGLPRDADLVLDARFLRNPHYIAALRGKTGLDREVQDYIGNDPGYEEFLLRITGLIMFLLPRFIQEGKKYASIAIGCTGGRHRSVALVEALERHLAEHGWPARVSHRVLRLERMAGAEPKPKPIRPHRGREARPKMDQASGSTPPNETHKLETSGFGKVGDQIWPEV
ncbi:MAG TPA: RNase adapter RapZ [Acetobacteraceae bacterium]|nr:RNase adapter RapZ [Acetobacteraceae bacterium]